MIRIASGVVLAFGFAALVVFGSPLHFFIFCEITVVVCLLELGGMLKAGGQPDLKLTSVTAGAAILAVIYFGGGHQVAAVAGAVLIVVIASSLLKKDDLAYQRASNTIYSIFYVTIPLSALALLRAEPGGEGYIIIIVTANAFSDIFAFFTGKSVGKTPLAPQISPGKTVEGFVGGLIGAMVGAVGAKLVAAPLLGLPHALAAGALAGFIGPIGDLAESSIKRKMGVKDSGASIPGHGGVLDRIDSLMFSAVSFYIYVTIFLSQ
ncbi:Phosphatidate cytidylyltransferase [hydrothermal vent metagenome]|uniref:Phosphatidate cytidylyltransferase n=1 Tax=hydrothermal vent metagenome TaxID=652676 RepID=A0A3B1CA54_9ZZZZ